MFFCVSVHSIRITIPGFDFQIRRETIWILIVSAKNLEFEKCLRDGFHPDITRIINVAPTCRQKKKKISRGTRQSNSPTMVVLCRTLELKPIE